MGKNFRIQNNLGKFPAEKCQKILQSWTAVTRLFRLFGFTATKTVPKYAPLQGIYGESVRFERDLQGREAVYFQVKGVKRRAGQIAGIKHPIIKEYFALNVAS